jgi:hypothetical protein
MMIVSNDTEIFTDSNDPALEFLSFTRQILAEMPDQSASPPMHFHLASKLGSKHKKLVISVFRGGGKLCTPDTLILSKNGWKTMEDVVEGDILYDMQGNETTVTYKTPLQHPQLFEFTYDDGTITKYGDEHLHVIRNGDSWTTKNSLELYSDHWLDDDFEPKYEIPLVKPIQYEKKDLKIHPYILGYFLASGYFNVKEITVRCDHMHEVMEKFTNLGMTIGKFYPKDSTNMCVFGLIGNKELENFKDFTFNTKHIPKEYLFSSVEQRTQLLNGLMDGSGVGKIDSSNRLVGTFPSSSQQLVLDVIDLVRSLGGWAKFEIKEKVRWKKYIAVIETVTNPYTISSKIDKWGSYTTGYKKITNIKPLEEDLGGYCITVDSPTHTYIDNGTTVTHNTVITEFWAMFLAFKQGSLPNYETVIDYMLYLSANDKLSKQFIDNISSHILSSKYLSEVIYIDKKSIIDRLILRHKSNPDFKLTIEVSGIGTSVRGSRKGMSRPKYIVVDDVLTDEMEFSETLINKIKTRFYKGILPMGGDFTRFVFIGTPMHPNDLLNELLENPKWNKHKYPIAEKFPVPREEFKGNWSSRSLFNYDGVTEIYETAKAGGDLSQFYQEYMLETLDQSSRLVIIDEIPKMDKKDVIRNIHEYNIYIATDLSYSGKKTSDLSAIGVFFVNRFNQWILVDGQVKRQPIMATVGDILEFIIKYEQLSGKNPTLGVESNGPQIGYLDVIREEGNRKNIYIQFAQDKSKGFMTNGVMQFGISTSNDKFSIFVNGVLPKFNKNEIILCRPDGSDYYYKLLYEELLDELDKITQTKGIGSKRDDAVDLLNQLSQMRIHLPTIQSNNYTHLIEEFSNYNSRRYF